MQPDSSVFWYLLFTKPANEERAKANLERQGYGVYFPRACRRVRRAGISLDRSFALFPRYIFLRVDTTLQVLSPVRSTIGVVNIVRFGSELARVKEGVIASLVARQCPQSGLHLIKPPDVSKPGTTVRLNGGSLSGLDGVFEATAGRDRVAILMNFLGRETRVIMPRDRVDYHP